MKTLDRNYLATHPEGDEKAEFSLSASVPRSMELPLNPDGTRPQITIDIKADTYLSALTALTTIHEDNNALIMGLVMEALTEDEILSFDSLEEAGPLIKERFAEVTVPFKTWAITLTLDDDDIELAITAPSVQVGLQALHYLTKPNTLTNTAIAMCPEVSDDEYGYSGDEVLVMS